MSKFIKLNIIGADECIINIDNISFIQPQSNTIILNGNHGEGDGVWKITPKSMERLLIKIINNVGGGRMIEGNWEQQKCHQITMNTWEKELYCQNKEKEVDKDQIISLQQEQIQEMQEHQEAMLLADKTIKEQQSEIEELKKQLEEYQDMEFAKNFVNLYAENKFFREQLKIYKERLDNAVVPKFKIGQKFYYISHQNGEWQIFDSVYRGENYLYVISDFCGYYQEYPKENVFSTKEEAQARLEELKGE